MIFFQLKRICTSFCENFSSPVCKLCSQIKLRSRSEEFARTACSYCSIGTLLQSRDRQTAVSERSGERIRDQSCAGSYTAPIPRSAKDRPVPYAAEDAPQPRPAIQGDFSSFVFYLSICLFPLLCMDGHRRPLTVVFPFCCFRTPKC